MFTRAARCRLGPLAASPHPVRPVVVAPLRQLHGLRTARPRLATPLLSPLLARSYNNDFRTRLRQEVQSGGLRRNAVTVTAFTIMISVAIGAAAYYLYLYNELVDKPLRAYPPHVAQSLKTALYYASRGDVSKMVSNFKAAIQSAEEAGMHPLSDEVAGLKIQCAHMLAQLDEGRHRTKAVDVMEHVLDEAAAGAQYFEKERRLPDRNRVLKRAVLLGYKVGEMYDDLGDHKSAREAMEWSTETLLKEGIRRHSLKITDADEGDWFDDVARAGCLEKMAMHYEQTARHDLATPLYLRAVTLYPQPSCHVATLMNNLASCLSQQDPAAASAATAMGHNSSSPSSSTSTDSAKKALPTLTKKHLVSDAQKWASKAVEIAAAVQPPQRTEECDEACIVATHNLGELAELLGDNATAAQKYQEALSLAKGLGHQLGMRQAEEGIRRAQELKNKAML